MENFWFGIVDACEGKKSTETGWRYCLAIIDFYWCTTYVGWTCICQRLNILTYFKFIIKCHVFAGEDLTQMSQQSCLTVFTGEDIFRMSSKCISETAYTCEFQIYHLELCLCRWRLDLSVTSKLSHCLHWWRHFHNVIKKYSRNHHDLFLLVNILFTLFQLHHVEPCLCQWRLDSSVISKLSNCLHLWRHFQNFFKKHFRNTLDLYLPATKLLPIFQIHL